MIAGVFLAAGQSKRFGADKLLYEFKGRPLVHHSLEACLASRLAKIFVVVPAEAAAFERAVGGAPGDQAKITTVRNERPERGMTSSLREGLASLDPEYDGAMIVLADMPFVTARLINELIAKFEETNGIVIPECDGELYHPRVIPRRLFSEFLRLKDDERGWAVIDKFSGDIVRVQIGEKTDYFDIDTARDLDRGV
jgi:molybdenum cofactor cytidylyltransferase